jgi:hypothetical protein
METTKPTYKVSPTMLSTFVDSKVEKWGRGLGEWLQELVEGTPENEAMQLGSFIHYYMEHGQPAPQNENLAGWTLGKAACEIMDTLRERTADWQKEERVRIQLNDFAEYNVVLSMRVDVSSKAEKTIVDYKTTRSNSRPNSRWYNDSPQIKAYSLIGGYDRGEYCVLKLDMNEREIVDVVPYTFVFSLYPHHADEVKGLIKEMVDFIINSGYQDFILFNN